MKSESSQRSHKKARPLTRGNQILRHETKRSLAVGAYKDRISDGSISSNRASKMPRKTDPPSQPISSESADNSLMNASVRKNQPSSNIKNKGRLSLFPLISFSSARPRDRNIYDVIAYEFGKA